MGFTAVIIVFIVCVVLHRLLFYKRRYSPPLPPSPMVALPVIGHLHLIDHDMRKVFRKYHRQLGDVYRLQFGERVVIVIAGYETIKEAFLKQGDYFARRPSMYITDRCNRNAGVVMTSDQIWREHRQFSVSTLKDFGMGKSMLERKVHKEVKLLLQEFKAMAGKPFDPKTVISTHVVNIISSIVFKGNFKQDDDRLLKMIAIIDENMELTAGVGNFLPWLAKLPGDLLNVNKLERNSDQVFAYAAEIIADHEKDYDENHIDDLTSAYIHEWRRLQNAGESTTMSYQQMAGVIGDLFIAGSHTSAIAIRWAIACLVNYPNIQERIYQEINTTVGTDRLPSVQDKTQLVYLEAFYLEVLRYCNMTIASAVHATTHDLTFKGYTIPKDAIILPDLDSVFTDKKIWGDPAVFRPERFIDDAGNLKKKDELIIFFVGKRKCIGEALAKMELLIFLGALIQTFKFESCPGELLTVDKVDGTFGFVHGPKPYRVMATPR